MEYNISLILGYLIGSIPFAYLVMKKSLGVDISKAGTGNVGAMNSYEVSNSRIIGIIVLILDAAKGVASAYIPMLFFPGEFTLSALALLGAVFAHCYNPWINFKGGRGLATSAGGAAVIFPLMLLSWIILYCIVYFMRRDIHVSNILASLLSMILFINISSISYKYTYPPAQSSTELVIFIAALMMLILIKHIEPLNVLLKNENFFYRKKR